MSKSLKILIAVITFVVLLAALVLLLKPTEIESLPQNEMQVRSQPQLQDSTSQRTIPTQTDSNEHQILLEKRVMLYQFLGELSFEMIEGQKPDLRKVTEMMMLQNELVKKGLIDKQEALNYLDFLRKVFPEMENELIGFSEDLNK